MGEEKTDSRETIAGTSLINQADGDADCDGNSDVKSSKKKSSSGSKSTKRRQPTEQSEKIDNNVKENSRTKTNETKSGSKKSNSTIGNGDALNEVGNSADEQQEQQSIVEEKEEKPAFKISIVPLEKLLAQPDSSSNNARSTRNSANVRTPKANSDSKILSVRSSRRSRNNNVSIVELSDSEDDTDEEDIIVRNPIRARQTRTNSTSSSTSSNNKTKSKVSGKKPPVNKKSLLSKLLIDSDSSTLNEEPIKRTLRRCVVRIQRTKLPTKPPATVAEVEAEPEVKASEKTTNKAAAKAKTVETTASKAAAKAKTAEKVTTKAPEAKVEVSNDIDNGKKSDSKRRMSTDTEMEKASTSKRNRREKSASDSDNDSDYKDALDDQAESEQDSDDKQNKSDVEAEAEEEAAHSSGSEVMPQRKRRTFAGKKDAGGSANDSSDFEPEDKKNKKKRRRIKKNSSGESDDDEKNKNKRKHIRKIIKTKDLDLSTKEAAKEEDDRRKRIEERQKLYNRIFEKSESVEINELVLDFDEDSKKALLQVDKGLLKKLKPHQVDGVKFMWDACFETLKESEKNSGSGCILAHCMGLGKTLQVVTLSHTLLINTRRTGVERVLVISPLSTVNNWAREFVHWMGFAHRRDIEVYDISKYKDKPTRIFKLHEWFEEGGVCILGYDMYRILANEKAKGLRKKQREQLQQALVDPGPDLVVCDEGHLLKNEKTSISKAVTRMRSKRRIVLTGTPLQNNLKEYYCMIQFVKPNLLGTYKEYMNRFVNPISNGQYTDSTDRDLRLMKHRSHILHKLLEGCIQRRDYSVLAPYLPPKHEYVVYTTLSELQQQLYGYYMTTHRDQASSDICGKGARLFQDFQDLRRIWTHPMNLRVNSDNVIAKRLLSNDDSDEMEGFICDESEEEDAASNSSDSGESFKSDASLTLVSNDAAGGSKVKSRKTRNGVRSGMVDSDSDVELLSGPAVQKDDPSEWWKPFVEEKELNNVNHSPKLLILLRLLQQCEAIGDKLLVFSQSLQSLDVIEHFLSLVDSNTKGYEFEGDVGNFKGCWSPGEDYFRLDGSCSVEQREAMCKKFNNATNLRARLFLISTRAGGLGINLVAANRVVIFDVSWNPSHDTQSIFRVYRFGQVKPCYIYRLIAMGTMEQKVYERQVAKQATAKRVIDEQQISRHYNQTDLMELYTYELKPSVEREMPLLPKDRLFAELLTEHENLIFKYHEHDSLLEQEEHENLTEEERKSAWAEYEAEKTRAVQASQYMSYDRNAFGATVASQFGNASGSVTSNKIFGFRSDILLQLLNMKISKDHPELTQNQVIQLVPSYLQQLYNEMNNGDPTMYKDLLQLHTHIVHPSGMYMNPLLYANQHPSAAGYNQGTGQAVDGAAAAPNAANATGFEADKVYEID
ncbi:transcriptional regulator ATRX homolog [Drosophila nasuta]|uniref:transcriptional regulator ATRX homolog n=1 Tax=Drosophila nasuta TaxID=42062 RepID=UPI00295EBDAB|nr:transcriptional regulator ATRX homolog [Drosophila nasuta]